MKNWGEMFAVVVVEMGEFVVGECCVVCRNTRLRNSKSITIPREKVQVRNLCVCMCKIKVVIIEYLL